MVRGVQFGLGLSLASLALGRYVPSMGTAGFVLAAAGLLAILVLWGNRRIPAGLVVIALGVIYAAATDLHVGTIAEGFGLSIPAFHLPAMQDILTGFVLLALPQIPLSLSNSVIATEQTVRDLFPGKKIGLRKIGLTYGIVNVLAPLAGGVPVCHGCGGLAGHYAFGARTGGSVIIYGSFYLTVGLFFARPLDEVLKAFPLPILGVVLLFEALTLLLLVRDQANVPRDLLIALLVGVVASSVPQGFLVGLILGSVVYYGFKRFGRAGTKSEERPERGAR